MKTEHRTFKSILLKKMDEDIKIFTVGKGSVDGNS